MVAKEIYLTEHGPAHHFAHVHLDSDMADSLGTIVGEGCLDILLCGLLDVVEAVCQHHCILHCTYSTCRSPNKSGLVRERNSRHMDCSD